jgi:sugar phosphate isomerase/epimerase
MIGIKVYPDTLHLYQNWDIDFFEIYIRPTDRDNKPLDLQSQLLVHEPIRDKVIGIHGGILHQNVNLMDESLAEHNQASIELTLEAAKYFYNCQYIVFHPGNIIFNKNCSFRYLIETVSQIKDTRFMLEFEPIFGYKNRYCFPLHRIEDWAALKAATNKELILDIGHALITAYAMNYNPTDYLKEFIRVINPRVIHVALKGLASEQDGYEDSHPHLYEGDYDLFNLTNELKDRILTIEVKDPDLLDLSLLKHVVKGSMSTREEFLKQNLIKTCNKNHS